MAPPADPPTMAPTFAPVLRPVDDKHLAPVEVPRPSFNSYPLLHVMQFNIPVDRRQVSQFVGQAVHSVPFA